MNKTLLQINASLFSDAGSSSVLANEFVAGWKKRNPGAAVNVRDFAKEPVPHLTAERFQAFITPADKRNANQRAEVAYSDALIDELMRADVIVLGVPMYNFDVPSTLKAYFDHIARAGVTFGYTEQGPVGKLTGKKVYVFASRGGLYAGKPQDTQTAYLKNFLGLLGIADIEFVHAEGLAISAASKEASLANAKQAVARLHARIEAPLAA
jgi:FMN-dependent NADH-azoreductase